MSALVAVCLVGDTDGAHRDFRPALALADNRSNGGVTRVRLPSLRRYHESNSNDKRCQVHRASKI
jgi:hypothetical protein